MTARTAHAAAAEKEVEGASPPSEIQDSDRPPHTTAKASHGRRILNILYWVPPRCRYNAAHPPRFTIWLNLLFAFAGAFTVANLYYSYPILNILAAEFDTSQTGVSRIPALMQAGYAVGLLFVLPLGDYVPIRRLTLSCILFTAVLWYVDFPCCRS